MKTFLRLAAAAALLVTSAAAASAHHIWIEVAGGTPSVHFGEFGEGLREASPGSLDKLTPQARIVTGAGEKPLVLEKKADGYAATTKVGAGESVVAEDIRWPSFTVTREGKQQRGLYWPAARFTPDRTAAKPVLVLDVVPLGGNKFQVFYQQKPLAKAKVEVVTPAGWKREETTGADGSIEVKLPWRGAYVLEVHHTDRTPGKRGEESYDFVNYVTSLTVLQAQGVEPLPAAKP